jgi:hypothetical protein
MRGFSSVLSFAGLGARLKSAQTQSTLWVPCRLTAFCSVQKVNLCFAPRIEMNVVITTIKKPIDFSGGARDEEIDEYGQ